MSVFLLEIYYHRTRATPLRLREGSKTSQKSKGLAIEKKNSKIFQSKIELNWLDSNYISTLNFCDFLKPSLAQTSVHISVYQILNNEYDIELVKLCSRSRLLQQKVILVEM